MTEFNVSGNATTTSAGSNTSIDLNLIGQNLLFNDNSIPLEAGITLAANPPTNPLSVSVPKGVETTLWDGATYTPLNDQEVGSVWRLSMIVPSITYAQPSPPSNGVFNIYYGLAANSSELLTSVPFTTSPIVFEGILQLQGNTSVPVVSLGGHSSVSANLTNSYITVTATAGNTSPASPPGTTLNAPTESTITDKNGVVWGFSGDIEQGSWYFVDEGGSELNGASGMDVITIDNTGLIWTHQSNNGSWYTPGGGSGLQSANSAGPNTTYSNTSIKVGPMILEKLV